MSNNDVLALNLYYKEWCETRLAGLRQDIDPFEYFCADQFLKPFFASDEDIHYGLVGDSNDGGVDGFYFFIGNILADDTTVVNRRSSYQIDLVIMQIKESKGFSPSNIRKLAVFTDDLLDIQRTPDHYRTKYHKRLLTLMRIFKEKYGAMFMPSVTLHYYFITKCDYEPDQDAKNAGEDVIRKAKEHFSKADIKPFHFINAQKLYDQLEVRKPEKKELSWEKSFESKEGWVGLVTLQSYYEFLKDEKGSLSEQIFDENVRGYQMNTAVNQEVTKTLTTSDKPEFWMLNNGITILTPEANSRTGVFEIKDPQIVNGLQTSRRIFDYFQSGMKIPGNDYRRILVRVIQNTDEDIRDEIIRATNNQNPMPAEALVSTYRIHKQIDLLFQANGLYYDYRKGHYKDQGKPISQIVSILSLVQAVIAIIIRKPDDARARPRDYIKDESKRRSIFGSDDYDFKAHGELLGVARPHDLNVYLQCVKIVRRVDDFIRKPALRLDNVQQRNVRFYLARYLACALTKSAYSPPGDLLKPQSNIDTFPDNSILHCFRDVYSIYRENGEDDQAAKGKKMPSDLTALLVEKYSLPKRRRANKSKTAKSSE